MRGLKSGAALSAIIVSLMMAGPASAQGQPQPPTPKSVLGHDVGEDYYLATSTFEWFPGVQIFHSRDLANWDLSRVR